MLMSEVRIAIAGVGNCASSLIQGLSYYRGVDESDGLIPGLMHNVIAGYKVRDIKPVAAFDVDVRKVGKDISQAMFEEPNCTKKFSDVEPFDVEVMKAPPMDGIAPHMKEWFKVDSSQEPVDVAEVLKDAKPDVLISYLPVGSENGVKWYAQKALDAGCAFVNCIPVFVASDPAWAEKFRQKNLPIIGDDIKSMVGATIVHRALTQMIVDRGSRIKSTYQINVGGNTDFLNMVDTERLSSKRTSKTESIATQIPYDAHVYAGPNGHIEFLNDNKICYLRLDFDLFGDVPASIDLKLSVEDSPNSAGVVIDAVRIAKLALDRGVGGALESASAYFMKHPPVQLTEPDARAALERFIRE